MLAYHSVQFIQLVFQRYINLICFYRSILLPGTPPPSIFEVKDIKSLWPLPSGYCLVDIFSFDEELSALRVTT